MQNIHNLFKQSKQIKIIENNELNAELSKLAVILGPYITNANNTVIQSIKKI